MSARSKQQQQQQSAGQSCQSGPRVFLLRAYRFSSSIMSCEKPMMTSGSCDARDRAQILSAFAACRAAGACGARSPSPLAAPCHWNCCRQNPARCAASLQTVALQSCVESILRVSMQKDMRFIGAHSHLAPSAFSPSRTFLLWPQRCRASFFDQFQAVRRGVREL